MSLQDIQTRIEDVCTRCGRNASDVTLIAVSKVQPNERVEAVLAEGHRVFGENRVQEACAARRLRATAQPRQACTALLACCTGQTEWRGQQTGLCPFARAICGATIPAMKIITSWCARLFPPRTNASDAPIRYMIW